MIMILNDDYKKEISELKSKMIEAQEFAEIFPEFKDKILKYKLPKDFTGKISDSYKGLYYSWGINRYFYKEKGNITNYQGELKPQYLWNIYINQLSVFNQDNFCGNSFHSPEIHEVCKDVDVFFYDISNTTFYATDSQIIGLLDALASWYDKAHAEYTDFIKDKKRKELTEQLDKLEA